MAQVCPTANPTLPAVLGEASRRSKLWRWKLRTGDFVVQAKDNVVTFFSVIATLPWGEGSAESRLFFPNTSELCWLERDLLLGYMLTGLM